MFGRNNDIERGESLETGLVGLKHGPLTRMWLKPIMKPPPEFLYKYRSLANRDWVQQIIAGCQIYYPAPEQINDPFDCKMPPIKSFSPWWARYRMASSQFATCSEQIEVWRKYLELRIRNNAELGELEKPLLPDEETEFNRILSDEIEQKLNATGVLSLSAVCDNTLMWSHYGDGHRGICLKFRLDEWPALKINIQEVKYPPDRLLLQLDFKTLHEGKAVEAIVLTKDRLWSYECEWRSLARTSGTIQFPEAALVGIIFGCQISTTHADWLRSIVPRTHIKFYQAMKKATEFGLDIREV